MQKNIVSRRAFIKSGVAASVALGFPTLVPSTVFGADAPSNRVNVRSGHGYFKSCVCPRLLVMFSSGY